MDDAAPALLRNTTKDKLARGERVYSMTVRLVRTIDIAAIARTAGFDSVYIDLEHSSVTLEDAGQIAMACNALGVTPLVRVPGLDPDFVVRVMDSGAMGIIVPGVESADDARAAVRAVKHAPLGTRSLAGAAPQLLYRPLPPAQVLRTLDETSMVVAMIESRAGLEAVEEIVAVDGIDMILVGANDLTVDLGIAGSMEDPQVDAAYRRIIEAARARGVAVGIGGLGAYPDLIRRYLDLGAQFVSTGNDISFLIGAAIAKRNQFA